MTDSNALRALLEWFGDHPLASFILAGGLIYGVHSALAPADPPVIAIEPAVIDKLVSERELVLDRSLTPAERSALRQAHIDQEILVREGIARNLHLHDGRIRHRLADKMLFLLAEDPPTPTPAALTAFYEAHRDQYMTTPTLDLRHVFFTSSPPPGVLERLRAGDEPTQFGEAFWLGHDLAAVTANDIVTLLGQDFAGAVSALPVGMWEGPLRSSRGWHFVHIDGAHPSVPIPRAQLDERLVVEWQAAARTRQREAAIAALRTRYEVASP